MNTISDRVANLSLAKRALLALELQSKLEAVDRLRAEPIAIVGMGCRFPGGIHGPESFWQSLRDGVDAVTEAPPERWDVQAYYDPDPAKPGKTNTRWGGFLDDVALFDARFFGISPRKAERIDPQQRLLLEVSWEALEDAGIAPERLRGTKTAVFIGISTHDYIRLLMSDPHLLNAHTGTGIASSIAANRLSYFYDFHGPSITIDAACASSLVAVHLACQSLRNGESDLAMVGGVNLILSPDVAISLTKLGLMSPSGRCRSFSAAADGYVRSEGVGVILLKPLSKARADRNQIYAVVRGSATNQNGRQSNGLTAPSQKLQEEVLREAYRQANVSPGQIQYVEAMALGTTLGDAIEAKALGSVLASERLPGEPCIVGAVKSNIGHLEAASGMAGMIKTALSLKHQEIPPSLHCNQLSPYIPFDELPLRVQQRLEPWPKRDHPALAGVSSSSFGGVNAHIVLEEAPLAEPSGGARPWHLLLLSARSDSALETATANLAGYLRHHSQASLTDIAYTLQIGRSVFDHRRMVICRDIEDAVTALEKPDLGRARKSFQKKKNRPVLFMFSGRESPCLNSVCALYKEESIFRAQVENCVEILRSQLEFDPRWIMDLIERKDVEGISSSRRPEISQALLFVIEYALAKLWMEWGVRPESMVGYGIGEYVAACLAGVFSLPGALELTIKRARMIQELPSGAMLVAPPHDKDTAPPPGDQLPIAAVDQPNLCAILGTPDAVERLNSRGVVRERMGSTQASNSKIMESICHDFRQLIESVERTAPQIPYLSSVTGNWIKAEEATDPHYWVRQLCQPVRFAEAIGQALTVADRIFMEIGIGQSLCSNVRLHPECNDGQGRCIIPALPDADDQPSTFYHLMCTVGELWLAGVQINWDAFYICEKRQRLSLPTYPFERQRYWFDDSQNGPVPTTRSATDRKKIS